MPNRKLKRHLNIGFRWLTILIICTVTVYLFPRGGSFQYEYQKGMQWRYETLYAPFSFPIHKTEEELQQEREKINEEQQPIFKRNAQTGSNQVEKFRSALHTFDNPENHAKLGKLTKKLESIYTAGILQLPEGTYAFVVIKHVNLLSKNKGADV